MAEEDIRRIRFDEENDDRLLELQIAMIAYRTQTALRIALAGEELRDRDYQALKMGASVMNTALYGGGVSSARRHRLYKPISMQFYEDVCDFLGIEKSDFRSVKREVLPVRNTVLRAYTEQEQSKDALQAGISFFDSLSKYGLNKDSENNSKKWEEGAGRFQAVA